MSQFDTTTISHTTSVLAPFILIGLICLRARQQDTFQQNQMSSGTPLDPDNTDTNSESSGSNNHPENNSTTTGESSKIDTLPVMTVRPEDEFEWAESLIGRYHDLSVLAKGAFMDELMLRRSTPKELLAFRETHKLLSARLEATTNPSSAITEKDSYESVLALLKDYHMSLIRSMASRGGPFERTCIETHLLLKHLRDERSQPSDVKDPDSHEQIVGLFIRTLLRFFVDRTT
jgi:hypothetical protein